MFFRSFLFLSAFVLYRPFLNASWQCRNLLDDNEGTLILFRINEIESDGSWIPADHELGSYKTFKESLPTELKNPHSLGALIGKSPQFKKALSTFINSLDASHEIKEGDSPGMIVNHLTKVLFNNGQAKVAAATKIAQFIQDAEISYASAYSADDFAKLSSELKTAKHARALDTLLEKRWNDSADTDVVYTWMTADKDPEIEAQLWGPGEEAPSNIIATLPGSQRNVQTLVAKHRDTPLIKAGEVYRDKFRASLEDFEKESLKALHDKYEAIFALKDKGAMDSIGKLLSPYLTPLEGKPTDIYNQRALEVLNRIFGSAHFFKEFKAFQEAYVEACNAILELSKDTQMTLFERRKLSTIAEEYVISYSIDLLHVGLKFNPPHEYRYRPLLLQMQHLNGQLQRDVVPVGALVVVKPHNDSNDGSLIIQP